MGAYEVHSLDDPRLEAYRGVKDRELARSGQRFIVEGEHVVRRLLGSDYPVESVLLAQRRVAEIASLVGERAPVYAVSDELMQQVLGFKFHSGVIACGRRKPELRLDDILPDPVAQEAEASRAMTLVICPEVINHDNMGSLIRISAAFGARAMVVGERSCDPFWRRSIRVSMGTIFSLPIYRSDDLKRDLLRLKQEWRVRLAATVLDEQAQMLETVRRPSDPDRLGILLGSESQGLQRRWVDLCDQKVTIPMQLGTDSLNVSMAAAVFLYHFTRVAGKGDERVREIPN